MTHRPLHLVGLAAGRLTEGGVDNARLEAELLLAHLLGMKRLDLYLQHERPLTPEEVDAYRQALRRRLRGEPIQYIMGAVQFRELRLRVDRRALIPRPETETLVGEVLAWASASRTDSTASGAGPATALVGLDIGTGTGAIALSLLHEGGFARVVATDSSPDALSLAAENAAALGLADRLELRPGSVWEAVRPDERFDVVVSNPPYVADAERGTLAREILDWEPGSALFAGEDGLAVLREVAGQAWEYLRPGGLVALEVGATQAGALAAELEHRTEYEHVRTALDLAGRPRMVLALRTGEGARRGEARRHHGTGDRAGSVAGADGRVPGAAPGQAAGERGP